MLLTEYAKHIVGVDVSEAMNLREWERIVSNLTPFRVCREAGAVSG